MWNAQLTLSVSQAILICYALVLIIAMSLRAYLTFENKRRDRTEGTSFDISDNIAAIENDDEELTDWNTKGFRYRM